MPKQKAGDDANPADGEQPAAEEAVAAPEPEQDQHASAEEAEASDDNGADVGEIETSEETLETLRETVATLEQDLAQARDQVLRARAEAENSRRRTVRDAENARKFALEQFTRELLPVIDNFERALEAADDDSAVHEGLDLSMKLLLGVLEKAGIEVVDPIGEPFDPTHHEAMATVDNPDAEPGSVTEVIQKGYVLNGRLLRAAMVLVAKREADKG